jgi:hypothetical protein
MRGRRKPDRKSGKGRRAKPVSGELEHEGRKCAVRKDGIADSCATRKKEKDRYYQRQGMHQFAERAVFFAFSVRFAETGNELMNRRDGKKGEQNQQNGIKQQGTPLENGPGKRGLYSANRWLNKHVRFPFPRRLSCRLFMLSYKCLEEYTRCRKCCQLCLSGRLAFPEGRAADNIEQTFSSADCTTIRDVTHSFRRPETYYRVRNARLRKMRISKKISRFGRLPPWKWRENGVEPVFLQPVAG